MPESVDAWWSRRQFSKGVAVPYAVGEYRSEWERYPALIRQYHPDLNHFVTLTQIPPAAEVFLTWECEVGHLFVATPEEQRNRPGRERRRSSWCPECAALAVPRRPRSRTEVPPPARPSRVPLPCGHGSYAATAQAAPRCAVCVHASAGADRVAVGEAFVSSWAPRRASAVEGDLHTRMSRRYDFDLGCNAIRVARPFFTHLEVWPDVIIPELRIALELDTVGRHALEHVGKRELVDLRKDRAVRSAGWEVIRIRLGKLQPLGPFDLCASGITGTLMTRLDERLAELRGELYVSAYRSGG